MSDVPENPTPDPEEPEVPEVPGPPIEVPMETPPPPGGTPGSGDDGPIG